MLISIIKTERDNEKYITMQEEILSGLSSYSHRQQLIWSDTIVSLDSGA